MHAGRFHFCPRCELRLASSPCPACGGETFDGRDAPARGSALARWRSEQRRRRWRAHWRNVRTGFSRFLPGYLAGVGLMGAVPGLGAMAIWQVDPGVSLQIVLGYGAMALAPLAVFLAWPHPMLDPEQRAAARRQAEEQLSRALPTPRIAPVERAPHVSRVTREGVVEGQQSLVSPLGGVPCLAWRLVGRGPLGPIDEAAAADLEVRGSDERVRVEAGCACVRIEPTGESVEGLSSAVRRELESRWAWFEGAEGPVRLREAVLRAGDAVRVTGATREEVRPDGYRGQRVELVLVDAPGAPLEIERSSGR